MPTLLARLDKVYAETQDPDQIAKRIARVGWVKGCDFTDEMIDEWANTACCYINDRGGLNHGLVFWFHRTGSDRQWLTRTSACKDYYFIRVEDYFEGSLP